MKKTVLKTILFTICGLIVVFALTFLSFVSFSPKTVANIAEDMGYYDYSVAMYAKHYKKNKNINNLYLLVNKAIIYNQGKVVVEYAPKLFEHAKYAELIETLDRENYSEEDSVLTNLKLSNSDNRLKSRFVKYLAKDAFEEAFDFSFDDFAESNVDKDINFTFVGLASYINSDNAELFVADAKQHGGKTASIMIYDKYQELKAIYQNDKASNSFYINATLSSKLVDMLQFMILLDSKTTGETYDNDALQADINTIFAEYQEYIR